MSMLALWLSGSRLCYQIYKICR